VSPAVAPFAALAELAREEHALVIDRRFDELGALDARRDVVLAALPAATPPAAVPHLQEAARLQALVTQALLEARDATRAELVRLKGARRGATGYAGPPAPARRTFDAAL
jgi:hypothetical protein